MKDATQVREYCCPGETRPVSRAVHFGRLTAYYPACRTCVHRDDTGRLSPKRVSRLKETRRRVASGPRFELEGVQGVYPNELDAATAGRLAAALGVYLRRRRPAGSEPPVVVLANDGRCLAAEIVAAVGRRLRWAGANLVDLGPASAPQTAFAIHHLQASGGLMVGDADGQARAVKIKFWADGAAPISAGPAMEEFQRLFEEGCDRPTRTSGQLRRFQADAPYLARLEPSYHALRPLRFVLNTQSRPLAELVQRLIRPTACRMIVSEVSLRRAPEQIAAAGAHFGVRVDDDGERAQWWDETGRAIDDERFFRLIAWRLCHGQEPAVVVAERETSAEGREAVARIASRLVLGDSRRQAMHDSMETDDALFGGGPSGRLWYRDGRRHYRADATLTLSHLLQLLSRSDRRMSEVLDAECPIE